MTRVRLIRVADRGIGGGPGYGQRALQKALRLRRPQWLQIGGTLRRREIPWYWCWLDIKAAVRRARDDLPFVCGPNLIFQNSRAPGAAYGERTILDAAGCRLMFTHSQWYADLIDRHRGPGNRAAIVRVPYPIDPHPPGPIDPPSCDLLIYIKNGRFPGVVEQLQRRYVRSRAVRYGRFRRHELWHLARQSRCCCYLADDDHGPLALAEILLSGCPAVGVPTGAPFVRHGRTGILLDGMETDRCVDAIEDCLEFDRQQVAALAAEQFDTRRIVDTVIGALHGASHY